LDKYIRFGDGSCKDLTLNQVYNILLDIQIKDWKTALKHVPFRKSYENRIMSLEQKVKKEFFFKNLKNEDMKNSDVMTRQFNKA
jgi:hypothetical protein